MKDIKTLIPDIQNLLKKKDGWFTPELAKELSDDIAARLVLQLGKTEEASTLRLSQMGAKCPKELWHSINTPEEKEPLQPWAELKFAFGHIIEALAIKLAKAAGHSVEGEQDEVVVDGVKGHRDCIIDGCIVDVKSAATKSFEKFKDGSLKENDLFGYLDQLDGYLVGSMDDPRVKVKDKAYLLAIDKQLGHMVLYEHRIRTEDDGVYSITKRIRDYKEIVGRSTPPKCTCETVSDGTSGNIKLGVKASYSSFKHCCFPNLRTFLYENGPRYLTKVVRRPMRKDNKTPIPEIDKYGRFV